MNWQVIKEFIADWYWLPLALMYLSIILSILGENRNPGKSLAYILVLVFLPVAGLLIYYFVGRQPVFKKPLFNRKRAADLKQMKAFYEMLTPIMEQRLELLEDQIGDGASTFRYLFNMHQSLISNGNNVRLLNNGEEFFPALFSAVENASKHIHIESYILTADDTGNRLTELLIAKKEQGVEVRVIADDVGSNRIKGLPKKMREAGISFLKTLPVTFNSLANSNYRNHRKVAVIDGSIGFIGGINLDDRYWNNGKHKLFWRDTSVIIEGPAVNLLQVQFFLSWLFSGGELPTGKLLSYLVLDNLKKGDATVAIVASGPGSGAPYIMETMLLAIGQARETIRITTPYFIPTDQLTTALQLAVANGIRVELLLPEKGDSSLVQSASFSYVKPLLERGVIFYLYQKGFVHSKTMFIDGHLAFVGTANMDTRSFFLNFEITSVTYGKRFCRQCEESFATDIKDSRQITLAEWRQRSVWKRGKDSVCRLIAPLL